MSTKQEAAERELLRQQGLEDCPTVLLLNADNSKVAAFQKAAFQFGLHCVSCEEELGDSRQGNGTIKFHVFKFTLVALEDAVKSRGRRTAVAQGRDTRVWAKAVVMGRRNRMYFRCARSGPVPGYQR